MRGAARGPQNFNVAPQQKGGKISPRGEKVAAPVAPPVDTHLLGEQLAGLERQGHAEVQAQKREEQMRRKNIAFTRRRLTREIKHVSHEVKVSEAGAKDGRKEVVKLEKNEDQLYSQKHKREEKLETAMGKTHSKRNEKCTMMLGKSNEAGVARTKVQHLAFALKTLEEEQLLPLEEGRKTRLQSAAIQDLDWGDLLAITSGAPDMEFFSPKPPKKLGDSITPQSPTARVQSLERELDELHTEAERLAEEQGLLTDENERARNFLLDFTPLDVETNADCGTPCSGRLPKRPTPSLFPTLARPSLPHQPFTGNVSVYRSSPHSVRESPRSASPTLRLAQPYTCDPSHMANLNGYPQVSPFSNLSMPGAVPGVPSMAIVGAPSVYRACPHSVIESPRSASSTVRIAHPHICEPSRTVNLNGIPQASPFPSLSMPVSMSGVPPMALSGAPAMAHFGGSASLLPGQHFVQSPRPDRDFPFSGSSAAVMFQPLGSPRQSSPRSVCAPTAPSVVQRMISVQTSSPPSAGNSWETSRASPQVRSVVVPAGVSSPRLENGVSNSSSRLLITSPGRQVATPVRASEVRLTPPSLLAPSQPARPPLLVTEAVTDAPLLLPTEATVLSEVVVEPSRGSPIIPSASKEHGPSKLKAAVNRVTALALAEYNAANAAP